MNSGTHSSRIWPRGKDALGDSSVATPWSPSWPSTPGKSDSEWLVSYWLVKNGILLLDYYNPLYIKGSIIPHNHHPTRVLNTTHMCLHVFGHSWAFIIFALYLLSYDPTFENPLEWMIASKQWWSFTDDFPIQTSNYRAFPSHVWWPQGYQILGNGPAFSRRETGWSSSHENGHLYSFVQGIRSYHVVPPI